MSDPAPSAPPVPTPVAAPSPVVELTEIEARVLGAMIEKSVTTPDVYPMTTNAIVTACNQKTNRDPVVDYNAVHVDSALLELRQRNLVRRVHTPGSRATKHRQTLDEQLGLDPAELAVLSVLLLRGPQTVGELRLRTERQHGFDDLESTEACLQGLADRPTSLVRQLPLQPGHKEARWQHLLGDTASPHDSHADTGADGAGTITTVDVAESATSAALAAGTTTHDGSSPHRVDRSSDPLAAHERRAESSSAGSAAREKPGNVSDRLAAHERRVDTASAGSGALEQRVDDLEAEVATLRRRLNSLAAQLGETLE